MKMNNFPKIIFGKEFDIRYKALIKKEITNESIDLKLIEIINIKQPNIIILENVKNLTIIDEGSVFKKIQEDLTNLNYNITYSILNVSDFGLPQNRERIFIIGIK